MGVDLKWPLYKLEGWPWPQVVNIIVESDSTAIEPLKNIIFKILSLFLFFWDGHVAFLVWVVGGGGGTKNMTLWGLSAFSSSAKYYYHPFAVSTIRTNWNQINFLYTPFLNDLAVSINCTNENKIFF